MTYHNNTFWWLTSAVLLFHHYSPVNAFAFKTNSVSFRSLLQSTSKRGGSFRPPSPPSPPPPPPIHPRNLFFHHDDDNDDAHDFNPESFLGASILTTCIDHHDQNDSHTSRGNSTQDHHTTILQQWRGGSDDIIAGTKVTLQSSTNYWSNIFPKQIRTVLQRYNPFNNKNNKKSRSSANKNNINDDDEFDLSTIRVQKVEAPQSTVLPDQIVRSAAQRSGLVGSAMRSDRVQECAKQIKKWYLQRGYVLHSVTGATLHAENSTATLTVSEPKSSALPVKIKFAKLVPIDPDTGGNTSMRKYKAKLERSKGRVLKADEWLDIKGQLNSTLIEAKGRTNPKIISKRLGLVAGQHFKWDGMRWENIAQSGIFARVFKIGPVKMSDGSVQVQVLAQESAPRNLEYGIQKSLYTGHWVSS
jgi:hypothetical protein